MIQNIFVAHSELLSASENLLQLADWCDQNFSPEEAPTDEVRYFPESKLPKKFFGGKTIKTTGQFAIQVWHKRQKQRDQISPIRQNLKKSLPISGDHLVLGKIVNLLWQNCEPILANILYFGQIFFVLNFIALNGQTLTKKFSHLKKFGQRLWHNGDLLKWTNPTPEISGLNPPIS